MATYHLTYLNDQCISQCKNASGKFAWGPCRTHRPQHCRRLAIRHLVMGRPHPLDMPKTKAYPVGSAGELREQLIHETTGFVLGRFNVG